MYADYCRDRVPVHYLSSIYLVAEVYFLFLILLLLNPLWVYQLLLETLFSHLLVVISCDYSTGGGPSSSKISFSNDTRCETWGMPINESRCQNCCNSKSSSRKPEPRFHCIRPEDIRLKQIPVCLLISISITTCQQRTNRHARYFYVWRCVHHHYLINETQNEFRDRFYS